jgi:predicted transcriptional regulator of viral defense system
MDDVVVFGSDMQTPERPRDAALAALAARQHGVVAGWQLIQLGVGRGAIKHRVAVGRLHRVHRGVYAVGHSAIGAEGRLMAAVLACGTAAVLSHRSAAWLWGLQPSPEAVEVTVPGSARPGPPQVIATEHAAFIARTTWS